jgi:hypothetical protein
MSITAMKQALDALEWGNEPMAKEAITALRAAISEQEKCEPVGYVYSDAGHQQSKNAAISRDIPNGTPLYTHPAPIPDGMVLVPVEPTEEMKVAGSDALGVYHCGSPSDIYKAMLQAAPKPGEKK